MSLIKKDMQNFNYDKHKNEFLKGISDSIIAFSRLSNKKKNKDIYSNIKNFKFGELNPEFIQILRGEFLDANLSL